MIGSLRGRLLHREDNELLIEVNGVGYRVTCTPATIGAAGDVGGDVFLHIHHHRREDAETLYGFGSFDERSVFETLIGTHGVGPALGLAILSVHSPLALRHVLAEDDIASLCLVPGVGKKTAARLLVELKSKLALPEGTDRAATEPGVASASSSRSEVREALGALGYAADEIGAALKDLPDDGDTSVMLRAALQRLAAA